jgi:hypothetical protein
MEWAYGSGLDLSVEQKKAKYKTSKRNMIFLGNNSGAASSTLPLAPFSHSFGRVLPLDMVKYGYKVKVLLE